MDVEQSYFAVSWFFNSWVRLMEYDTREMEVVESAQLGPRRLIISPPTDAGIRILAHANSSGQTDLLCFSTRLQRVAARYARRHRIKSLATTVESFFQIAVYMAPTSGFGSRLWAWVFDHFTFMSHGCSPITISAHLTRNGFETQKEVSVHRFGFPVIYSVSERQIPVN